MDTTRIRIVILFLGAVGGAVAGWFAHLAVVAPNSDLSASEAPLANSAPAPSVQPTKAEFRALAPGPLLQPTKSESRAAAPASGGELPLFVTGASSPVAKGTSRANAVTRDESEQPSAVTLSQTPALDDLRDSVSVRCTFGPGNGGSWPNGKLTVGDAAWRGGPIDFQSIDYDSGTAQMFGQVARSPQGQVPATVTISDSDVTFTGRAANGTLTIVSMFGKFDNAAHHMAVLSMHDGRHELDIAQFYGSCDSALKR